ncbi:alpha/beta fold hydrolase [Fulvimonas sp. R45]|uniref:alpha/beta hydrolase n=1 Tax=Fulvimonas sp. R45 TaxID=3045937 RepID=UPI00265F5644|nr:alpha/beta fold hydrolase [Fulvimonas sp. R45]MDO1527815.1 alpha/beta fold hydrolase [Fulvimonas sp. R45]
MSLLLALGLASAVSTADLQANTVYLPAGQPGQRLALHCVAPPQATRHAALFVHGASFPTGLASGFEFAPGDSWLAFMARRGYLACGLDFLGFGNSSRPPAMVGAAGAAPPVTRAPEAAREIARAVDYLRTRRGMATVHLVAHSWGTIPAATYAASHPQALASLTLFGPVVPSRDDDAPITDAWWTITARQRYRQLRFERVLPKGVVLLEPAVTQRWTAAFDASVPHVPGDAPGALRIPAGPVADIAAAEHGDYPYDPAKVAAPVFVVYGDHDTVVDDARAATFLARFTASPLKWRLRIDHGTHVMHLERNRRSLYRSVAAFIGTVEDGQR